jgi:general nucleoside transport system permease protein
VIRRLGRGLLAPASAAVIALAVSSIALLISGNNPVTAFVEMWKTIDSSESVVLIINRAVPYYVAGVAVAIGFRMNLFNIGANGQYTLAALLAASAGAAVSLPAPLHVAFILLVAMLVGAAWAAIAGVLKVTRGVNEVISTIMLNYIATGLTAFLVAEYLRSPTTQLVAETRKLPESARLPSLNPLLEFVGINVGGNAKLLGFLPFAIALGIAYHLLLNRSRFGYELRVSGANPSAARTAGISPNAMVLKAIILSGAVAGLVGMSALLADPQFHKYGDQFPKTLGFTGIALALLGRNHPGGVAVAALVWATIERATQRLSPLGIPQEIGVILQGSFLLAAVIAYEVVQRRNAEATAREAARATATATAATPPTPEVTR